MKGEYRIIIRQNNIIMANQFLIMKALVIHQKDSNLQLELMERIHVLEQVVKTVEEELGEKYCS